MTERAILALEDGTVFHGRSIGCAGLAVGEVVFNTAMTGYQEILSDPSYCQQLVTLTYPHIGNVGTNAEDQESQRVFAAGLIIRDLPLTVSSWRAEESLPDYLAREQVVAIADIDTRQLTRKLRDQGSMRGCLQAGSELDAESAVAAAVAFPGLQGADLAQVVTTSKPYAWAAGEWGLGHAKPVPTPSYRVVAYDFGVKHNILRILTGRGCEVSVVPATTSADEILAMAPDGVFLSNGPGDPEPCDYAISAIAKIVEQGIPAFGICLGYQLLALACGARTSKMKFGHHGANHPVQDLATGMVMITSQNHGFMVDEDSLPAQLTPTHRSLFDGSLQGISHTQQPAFGFQGHPEASPGPHDIQPLFEQFIDAMKTYRA